MSTKREIIERIRSAENLPSLPKVAVEVIRLTQADDASMADIAAVIQNDPALTGRLLKVVNSSLFGMSREIWSLQQAMVVLGLRTVKVMTLSFSLVDAMDKGRSGWFDYAGYWRRSLTAAVAARLIAEQSALEVADEAFVGGLLCDIGMLAAFRCARTLYAPVLEQYDPLRETIQTAERRVLGLTHETISAELLNHWGLPGPLCLAVGSHHAPVADQALDEPVRDDLTRLIRSAATIADLFCSESQAGRLSVVKQEVTEGLGMGESALQEILEALDKHVKETASLFALKIGTTRDYQDIQAQATAQLAKLTMAMEQEQARIVEREEAARRQVAQLNDQNRELAQQASTDALTGVGNRAALEHRLIEECQKAARGGTALGLIILDLDRFKKLNDSFGHRAGDEALRLVGACLRGIADGGARFPARYGGEEFAMVVANAAPREIRELAEEIRLAIQSIRIPFGSKRIAITASVGAALMAHDDPALKPGPLVELADQCLYHAKHQGRNRVVFSQARPELQVAAPGA